MNKIPPTTEEITREIEDRMRHMLANPEKAAQIEDRKAKAAEAKKNIAIAELRTTWGAPKRHVACNPPVEGEWGESLKKLKAMLEPSTGRLIGIVGTRGNGKTQLAVEAMKFKTELLHQCRFTTAVEFFIRIKATYRPDAEHDEMEVLKEFQKPKLLVIDEIGKRGSSDWENTMLFELLNRRYNDMNDTILIDNRSRQDFTESIGPSLASRMSEGGGIMECGWESFRA